MRDRPIVLATGFCLLLAGCATGYVPPTAPHTYTTDTQAPHLMTGVRLNWHRGTMRGAALGLFLMKCDVRFYVDGRPVFSVNPAQADTHTLLQIPPGQHALSITWAEQGLLTAGMVEEKPQFENYFWLRDGQVGTITCAFGDPVGSGWTRASRIDLWLRSPDLQLMPLTQPR